MSSHIVSERPPDKHIGRFFRQEDPKTFPPEPCDPPDSGGVGAELPGEEIFEDYSDPPDEEA